MRSLARRQWRRLPCLRGRVSPGRACGCSDEVSSDIAATCSYTICMKTVTIREAKNRLTELARKVERGETIVVTRNRSPVLELRPDFKRKRGIETVVAFITDDFDDPPPEDFLRVRHRLALETLDSPPTRPGLDPERILAWGRN